MYKIVRTYDAMFLFELLINFPTLLVGTLCKNEVVIDNNIGQINHIASL